MQYRKATIDDAHLLAELRKAQLIDEGQQPDSNIDEALQAFFRQQLKAGEIAVWLAEEDGKAVATGGIMFMQFPPSFENPTGIRGYITGMYTHHDYRRRGIATAMLDRLTDEARARNIHMLWLGASEMGEPVYIKYGFQRIDNWFRMDI